jgi:DNA modification methylase
MANSKGAQRALKIEFRSVASLVPYANNAREHSDDQVAKIARSIERFGFNAPVLVDTESVIVAGHGRVMAAASLGLEKVPVIELGHLSIADRRAYRLADNRIALDATWNEDLLRRELDAIAAAGIDLSIAGFSDEDLDRLLSEAAGETSDRDVDQAPAVAKVTVSRAGDVWLLGEHRIICGDSSNAEDVMMVLAGERPHLMVTDPPYGVEYDPGWRLEAGQGSAGQALGKVRNDDRADWRQTWALFPGSVAYVWHAGTFAGVVDQSLKACGLKIRAQIVWVKSRPVLSRGHYHWQHEGAMYATKEAADDHWRFVPEHFVAAYAVQEDRSATWHGGRKQSTVWFIEHLKNDTGHGTQKPVECMRRPIINNSIRGDAVYEPFSGSGTTIIAAEMTKRRCLAIEIDPAYVDVAVRRWENFTGKFAVHGESGRAFADVAAERGVPLAA